MLLCVQTQQIQITLWCLNFYTELWTVHKEKSSVHLHPLQFAQNAPEGPVLDPVVENFPIVGGRSCAPPRN